MITLVALVTDHFRLADCPRSTVLGSIVNETTVGRPVASLVLPLSLIGGGVAALGRSGAFFLHPTLSAAIRTTAPNIAPRMAGKLDLDIKKPPETFMKLLTPH